MKKLLALAMVMAFAPLYARSIEGEIKRILAKSAIAKTGYIGILVVDPKGRTVMSLNSGHLFTPASNTKLFSTALALEKLGPDKRFETRVELRGKDLVLIGTGDANLSGRVLPYIADSKPGPALAVIDDLATQIAAHGITSVEGDIVGDDTAFVYEPFASSWTLDDTIDGDGPATSALVVNDNIVRLKITPPSSVEMDPNVAQFHVDVPPASGADVINEERSVGDPALFAALALRDALARRGISIAGSVRALHREGAAPFVPPQQAKLSPPTNRFP